jgi:hypothetical protein
MGAVFCRAYQQPFFPSADLSSADEESRRELLDLLRKSANDESWRIQLGMQEREREYLRRFPIFDLNDELGEHTSIFGPFIQWFFQLALDQLRSDPSRTSRDLLRDEVKAVTRLENPSGPASTGGLLGFP